MKFQNATLERITAGLLALGMGLAPELVYSQATARIAGPHSTYTPYTVVSRDANSCIWERTEYEQTPSGEVRAHVHRYQEIATGLNFWNSATGQWEPSSEVIQPIPGGAAVLTGQHKVIFAANLATFGAIQLETPDGQQLRSHLLGLSYLDQASGKSVFIAEVTNSIGQLISSNQLWYDNAFTGIKAGVRYTYTRQGFEQDVILEEQPAPPEAYGLSPGTTVLEAITEFISPPEPVITTNALDDTPGLPEDETLQFGTMRFGRGRAFLAGSDSDSVVVSKHWITENGRWFLVEQLPVAKIAAQLRTLPAAQNASIKTKQGSVLHVVSKKPLFPPSPLPDNRSKAMDLASIHPLHTPLSPLSGPALVLDYVTLNTSQTNWLFAGDTTYYLSGNVNLYGTNTTFEGGTVLKYASNVVLTVDSPVSWLATPYRPVVMLSKDCTTTGEPISGATGNPGTNYYAKTALYFDGNSAGTNLSIENLKIANASTGVSISRQTGHVLDDLQIVNCRIGIAATNTAFGLHNALFWHVLTNFSGNAATGHVEHLTSDTAKWLNKNIGQNLFLTNCLLTAVANLGNCTLDHVANLPSNSGVFQAANPGGYHYLAANSPYRGVGTTNISPAMLTKLAQKTTYPPLVFSNQTFSTATNFGPQALRDTGLPDYGYLYDPLDYVFGGCTANTNMNFTAGTAVGWFRTSSGWSHAAQGIRIDDQQVLTFTGTATSPDYWVRCNAVQEEDNSGGYGPGGITSWTGVYANAPTVNAEFLKSICVGAWGENAFRDDSGYLIGQFEHCEFYSCGIGSYVSTYFLTNCLLYRANLGTWQGSSANQIRIQNCTVYGGYIYLEPTASLGMSIKDCSLDAGAYLTLANLGVNPGYANYDYNAYPYSTNLFPIGGSHDQKSVNFNWQSSWLGTFYAPTNSAIVGAGDVTADQIGLYHFTTQTNQVPEGTSVVDIGYHYVATDTYGNPLDSNGDGIPDYQEDPIGNGLPYNGTNWALAILVQPDNTSASPGGTASFGVTADGVPTIVYQWYSNSVAIPGATNTTFTLNGVQTNAAGDYFVVVADNFGSITSAVATLTIGVPPMITQEPSNVMVLEGANVSFNSSASGTLPLSYQWYFNGTAVPAATNSSLNLGNVQLSDGGNYSVVVTNNCGAATSAIVTLVDYTNTVNFDIVDGQYFFNYVGSDETLTYEYVPVWPGWVDGTLGELTCTVNGTNEFLPSNAGGLSLIATDSLNPTNHPEVFPWDPNVVFTSVATLPTGNSVESTWQMAYLQGTVSGSLTYTYTFQMTGRTLSVQVASTLGNSGGLYLDRCEAVATPAVAPAIINVPYLPLMNVLYWNGVYCSLYSDWEHSSASTNTSLDEMFSGTSDYYAQDSFYLPRTDGTYNPVNETVLLTVSPSMSDVLPTVHNPQSPYKTNVANYLVFDDWEAPFATVNSELESLTNAGVTNLWVIVHDWQNEGYDNGYPDVLPAYPGMGNLNAVSQTASAAGYLFALHENYVDFYPDATNSPGYEWNSNDVALNPNGSLELSWSNQSAHVQSYLMKPTRASNYLAYFAPQIHTNYGTTAAYLDAHSSLNPSARVDYDSSTTNAGTFLETLSSWRNLYGLLRTYHGGPVSGEGDNHMLSLGYLDDVEAQIDSGGVGYTNAATEQWLPLLVDFDLLQLHNLTTVHGVGYYERFYSDTGNTPQYITYSNAAVLEYMATELAYGHGGFIPTPSTFSNSNFVWVAQLEENYVFPAQQLYANATPVSILYHDSNNNDEVSASDYIRRYPHDYYSQSDPDYMSQVRVTYNNGVVVCVNRHPTKTWQVQVGQTGGWFDYNAMIGTNMVQWTGVTNTTSYALPPNCGWVVFAPATGP